MNVMRSATLNIYFPWNSAYLLYKILHKHYIYYRIRMHFNNFHVVILMGMKLKNIKMLYNAENDLRLMLLLLLCQNC